MMRSKSMRNLPESAQSPTTNVGNLATWKAQNLDGLGDETIGTIVTYSVKHASPSCAGGNSVYGNAIARAGEDETALGGRDAYHVVPRCSCDLDVGDPADSETHIA
jgi:hypothetical protein